MIAMLRILLRLGLFHPQAHAAVPPSPPAATKTADETTAEGSESKVLAPTFRASLEADPDAEHRVSLLLDDDVDVAELERKYPDNATLMRQLQKIRRRQQAPVLAAFRRKGLRVHDLSQTTLINAMSLTASGRDILRMATVAGIRSIRPPQRYKPTSRR